MRANWFVNKRRLNNPNYRQSPAEYRVASALKRNAISFESEVSFPDCRSPQGNVLIFDFIVPDRNLLIEYDGLEYHNTEKSYAHDKIKTKYAAANGYKLLRLNSEHWGNIEGALMNCISKLQRKKRKKQVQKKKKDPFKTKKLRPAPKTKDRKAKKGSNRSYAHIRVTIDDWPTPDSPFIKKY